jgi:hypothetical protein
VINWVPPELDSEDKVREELRDQHVTGVQRMKPGLYKLTFDLPRIPAKVYLWRGHEVREYEDKPMHCFRCQRFYHAAGSCREELICRRCGRAGHIKAACTAAHARCINCGGQHEAGVWRCQATQTALHVQRLRLKEGLTTAEARKEVAAKQVRETEDGGGGGGGIGIGNGRQQWQRIPEVPLSQRNRFAPFADPVTPEGSEMEAEDEDEDGGSGGWSTGGRAKRGRGRTAATATRRPSQPIPVIVTTTRREADGVRERGAGTTAREEEVEAGREEEGVGEEAGLAAAGNSRQQPAAAGNSRQQPAAAGNSRQQPATAGNSRQQPATTKTAQRWANGDGRGSDIPGWDPVQQQAYGGGRGRGGRGGGVYRAGWSGAHTEQNQQADQNAMDFGDMLRLVEKKLDSLLSAIHRILDIFLKVVGLNDILQGGSGGCVLSMGAKCVNK